MRIKSVATENKNNDFWQLGKALPKLISSESVDDLFRPTGAAPSTNALCLVIVRPTI